MAVQKYVLGHLETVALLQTVGCQPESTDKFILLILKCAAQVFQYVQQEYPHCFTFCFQYYYTTTLIDRYER